MRTRDIWHRLEIHPPILLRLLARIPRSRALESTEIADRSGLSVIQVEAISQQTTWVGVDLPTARAFMMGCNCDITDRITYRRLREYLKRQPKKPVSRFEYLRQSPAWETYYVPMLERFGNWLKSCRSKTGRG